MQPPGPFVAVSVQFAMVKPAKRYSEFVAYFESHSALLSELEVMWIRRAATAGKAGLGGHELQMTRVAQPEWFAKGRDKLRRSLRSCVGDRCILVRRAAPGYANAIELASGLGLFARRNRFVAETCVAVRDHRLAVAVG